MRKEYGCEDAKNVGACLHYTRIRKTFCLRHLER